MAYYTLDHIRAQIRFTNPIVENHSRKDLEQRKIVFLSHSHKDSDLVMDVMAFLLSVGMFVYVDWLDSEMPHITSHETASRIKVKIKQCDRLIVLLTENSKDSKWVPWELGYADGVKSIEKIAILPIKRNVATLDSHFIGLEYMKLYPIISVGTLNSRSVPSIFPPKELGDKGRLLNEGWLAVDKIVFK
jgi:hypothetical protein